MLALAFVACSSFAMNCRNGACGRAPAKRAAVANPAKKAAISFHAANASASNISRTHQSIARHSLSGAQGVEKMVVARIAMMSEGQLAEKFKILSSEQLDKLSAAVAKAQSQREAQSNSSARHAHRHVKFAGLNSQSSVAQPQSHNASPQPQAFKPTLKTESKEDAEKRELDDLVLARELQSQECAANNMQIRARLLANRQAQHAHSHDSRTSMNAPAKKPANQPAAQASRAQSMPNQQAVQSHEPQKETMISAIEQNIAFLATLNKDQIAKVVQNKDSLKNNVLAAMQALGLRTIKAGYFTFNKNYVETVLNKTTEEIIAILTKIDPNVISKFATDIKPYLDELNEQEVKIIFHVLTDINGCALTNINAVESSK
jgi:hypothetical protein